MKLVLRRSEPHLCFAVQAFNYFIRSLAERETNDLGATPLDVNTFCDAVMRDDHARIFTLLSESNLLGRVESNSKNNWVSSQFHNGTWNIQIRRGPWHGQLRFDNKVVLGQEGTEPISRHSAELTITVSQKFLARRVLQELGCRMTCNPTLTLGIAWLPVGLDVIPQDDLPPHILWTLFRLAFPTFSDHLRECGVEGVEFASPRPGPVLHIPEVVDEVGECLG
jgi:hypothetical protein